MKKGIILVFITIIFIVPLFVFSAIDGSDNSGGGAVSIPNPLGNDVNPNVIIGKIIQAILGIVGSLALLMFVYGGFTWMLSAGNNEKVQKGKDILLWSTIGLVTIFASYAFIRLIFQGLGL